MNDGKGLGEMTKAQGDGELLKTHIVSSLVKTKQTERELALLSFKCGEKRLMRTSKKTRDQTAKQTYTMHPWYLLNNKEEQNNISSPAIETSNIHLV